MLPSLPTNRPFTAAEAALAGVTAVRLHRLVVRGDLTRVLRGVYANPELPDSLELRAAAASLVVPNGWVVCGRTAAWLWGVDALAMGAHRATPAPDVMAPAGRSASRRSGVFGRSGQLQDGDAVLIGAAHLGQVPVTTRARTAADLARLLPRPDAIASLDAMLRAGPVRREDIDFVLGRFAGYRGVRQARELVALASPLAESPMESRARLRCVDAGFPVPEPQIEVRLPDGSLVARLDMGWRLVRKALEFDGDEHHSKAADMAHDRHRRSSVESCGWNIAVVTAAEVLGRHLEFERIVSDLLGTSYALSQNHPARGGWSAVRAA